MAERGSGPGGGEPTASRQATPEELLAAFGGEKTELKGWRAKDNREQAEPQANESTTTDPSPEPEVPVAETDDEVGGVEPIRRSEHEHEEHRGKPRSKKGNNPRPRQPRRPETMIDEAAEEIGRVIREVEDETVTHTDPTPEPRLVPEPAPVEDLLSRGEAAVLTPELERLVAVGSDILNRVTKKLRDELDSLPMAKRETLRRYVREVVVIGAPPQEILDEQLGDLVGRAVASDGAAKLWMEGMDALSDSDRKLVDDLIEDRITTWVERVISEIPEPVTAPAPPTPPVAPVAPPPPDTTPTPPPSPPTRVTVVPPAPAPPTHIPPAAPDGPALRLHLADIREAIRQQAIHVGEERLQEKLAGKSGESKLRRLGRSVWKGNLAREYYRQKEIAKAKKEILGDHLYAGSGLSQEDYQRSLEQVFSRLTADNDELLLQGESVERASEAAETAMREALREPLQAYARGDIDADVLREQFTRALYQVQMDHPELLNERFRKEEIVSNLLAMAGQLRLLADTDAARDRLIDNMQIYQDQAKLGLETRASRSRIDRAIERIQGSFVGSLVNETTLGVAVGAAYSLGVGATRNVAVRVGATVAPRSSDRHILRNEREEIYRSRTYASHPQSGNRHRGG